MPSRVCGTAFFFFGLFTPLIACGVEEPARTFRQTLQKVYAWRYYQIYLARRKCRRSDVYWRLKAMLISGCSRKRTQNFVSSILLGLLRSKLYRCKCAFMLV